MYETILKLQARPFATAPNSDQALFGHSMQKALSNTRLCIDRGSGPALIIGCPGVGKTSLLNLVGRQYESQFHVVNISCSRMDGRQEFLQTVLFELRQPYRGLSEGELRLSLLDFLRRDNEKPNGLLLMIDDGENLAVEVLDEIRVVSNFVQDGHARTQLVLVGGFRLEELLNDARLQSLNQRIAARCFLRNLTQTETAEYVLDQMHRVGGDGLSYFCENSLQTIFEFTEGCPRLVNLLCDHALILCATNGFRTMEPATVREAWSDLQCLPDVLGNQKNSTAFCETEGQGNRPAEWSIIEFGSLEDGQSSDLNYSSQPAVEKFETRSSDDSEDVSELGRTQDRYCDSASYHESEKSTDAAESAHQWQDSGRGDESAQWNGLGQSPFNPYESQIQWNQTAEEPEGQLPAEEPPVTEVPYIAPNPFVEHFSEVEVVESRFASQIARFNRCSQDLMPHDLSCLQALADANNWEARQAGTSNEVSSQCLAQPSENRESRFESYRYVSQGDQPSESDASEPLAEAVGGSWSVPNVDETAAHPPQSSSRIAEEADSLLQQLASAFGESVLDYDRPIEVSHETSEDSSAYTIRLASDSVSSVNHSDSHSSKWDGSGQSELNDLQALRNAIEEQNKFSAQAFDRPVVAAEDESKSAAWRIRPAPVQSMIGLKANELQAGRCGHDDRDLLICQPSEEISTDSLNKTNENRLPFPPTPVSTGRAERMDYQQLFDQLRNLPNT